MLFEENRSSGGREAPLYAYRENNSSKDTESLPPAPYWLLVDYGRGREESRNALPEVFTVWVGGSRTLPLFRSEEEAIFFAALCDEEGYQPRKTWGSELVSSLVGSDFASGPCAGVERVSFTHSSLTHSPRGGSGGPLEFSAMSRKCFLDRLMGRGGS